MQIKDLKPGDTIYLWNEKRWTEATVTQVKLANLYPYIWVYHTKGHDLFNGEMAVSNQTTCSLPSNT